MSQISHKQAIQWIDRRSDELLSEDQALLLDEHLSSCDTCRLYAAEMEALPTHLQNEFHARWEKNAGPSQKVLQSVTLKAGNISAANRFSSAVRLFAGAAALVLLGVVINFVISQLRNTSILAAGPEAANRLLAFAAEQNGKYDIYTIHADGSGLTKLTDGPEDATQPVWSPDGTHIAFRRPHDGFLQLYVMDSDGSNVIQLTNDKTNSYIVTRWNANNISSLWSPDGSKLLFSQMAPGLEAKGTLYVVNVDGQNKKSIVNEPDIYLDPSWSPDGNHIAFLTGAPGVSLRLHVVNTDGSNLIDVTKSLTENQLLYEWMSPLTYSWSQDGQSIFFIVVDSVRKQPIIYEASLDGNKLVEKAALNGMLVDWWEATFWIAGSRDTELYKWFPSAQSKILEQCGSAEGAQADSYQRSSAGNIAITHRCSNGRWRLYWANPKGTVLKQLYETTFEQHYKSPYGSSISQAYTLWSPDDQYIAFNFEVPQGNGSLDGTSLLYILDVGRALADSSSQPIQIPLKSGGIPCWQPISNNEVVEEKPTPTDSPAVTDIPTLVPTDTPASEPTQPVPSQEGLIAFTSVNENSNSDIYTMYPDGNGLTNLTNHPAYDGNPFWSPDGKHIAFQSDRSGSMQIYLMDADGSRVTQVTDGKMDDQLESSNPWSPDGTRLLFTEREARDPTKPAPGDASWMFYVVDIDGQNKIPLTQVPSMYGSPSWSPDGEHIAFFAIDSQGGRNLTHIDVVDANGGNRTDITKLLSAEEDLDPGDYAWSRDGQSISFIAHKHIDEGKDQWIVYEASLDGSKLTQLASSSSPMGDWWDGTAFITGFGGESTFTWLRSDGTYNTLNPFEKCQTNDTSTFSYIYRRSSNGNLLIGASCPNSDLWFYWANPDGTVIQPLLDAPITDQDFSMINIVWSNDDKYVAFNVASPDKTRMDLYILDIEAALHDPSTRPLQIQVGGISATYTWYPAWQPKP